MDDGMDEIIHEFLVESHENLDQIDVDLVALEKDPDARDRLARVFRAVHTIKGANVFTSLFNGGGGPHVRLGRVWFNAAPPPEVLAPMDGSLTRDDMVVTVSGYGAGRLSVVLPATAVATSGAA